LHSHGHGHCHHHGTGAILRWSLIATTLFVVIEFIAGIQAHSLALLSDAGHNFTDALALGLAWAANYLQARPADESRTYGYHRAGVLSAFVNALTLAVLSVWILYEAVLRLRAPEPVNEITMIVVSAFGLAVNAAIMIALRAASRNDLNIRGAFIHMLGDALGSAAIIAGAIFIRFTGWERIDPILSIGLALLIIYTAWDIVRESLNILLEGLPRGMKLADVTAAAKDIDGVLDVHDLHIWSLGSGAHALSCHVLIEDVPPSASDSILRRINNMLSQRFAIGHTTIQFEHMSCSISETGCAIPVHDHHLDHRH